MAQNQNASTSTGSNILGRQDSEEPSMSSVQSTAFYEEQINRALELQGTITRDEMLSMVIQGKFMDSGVSSMRSDHLGDNDSDDEDATEEWKKFYVKDVTDGQLTAIILNNLHTQIEKQVHGASVDFVPGKITLRGNEKCLDKAIQMFEERFTQALRTKEIPFDKDTLKLLMKPPMFHYLTNLFSAKGVKAGFDIYEKSIQLNALSDQDLEAAEKLIDENIEEQEIPFDYDTGEIYTTMMQTFSATMKQGLSSVSMRGNSLKIVGVKKQVHDMMGSIRE